MTDSSKFVQRPHGFRTTRTIVALILREMATTHGRSALGYFWAILEPAAGLLLLSFIFSLAFKSPPMGSSFSLFYATGLLPFMMYSDISQKLSVALRFSKPLLFYPGVTFIDALVARFVLNTLTQVMVFAVVLTTILVAFRVDVILDLPRLALGVLMALSLALGIGTLNCFLLSMFPVWERSWAVLNRPLFIISCIFYLFENVPQPFQAYLWFNPIIHIVGQVRQGIYPTYYGAYISPLYVFGVSAVCFAAGLLLLRRYHREIVND
jgi:capsular polysaccharide transport system permease protein